jgi:predicted dehydrogenase
MSLRSSIGVAFLGIGRMGETHLRNLLGISGVRVVVVADPRLEAAERGKALAGAEQALMDVAQAITYPGVDAVVIVTPTALSKSRRYKHETAL